MNRAPEGVNRRGLLGEALRISRRIRDDHNFTGYVNGQQLVAAEGYTVEERNYFPPGVNSNLRDNKVLIREGLDRFETSEVLSHEAGEGRTVKQVPHFNETFADWIGLFALMPQTAFRRTISRFQFNVDSLRLLWDNVTLSGLLRRIPLDIENTSAALWAGSMPMWRETHNDLSLEHAAIALERHLVGWVFGSRGRAYDTDGPWEGWAYRLDPKDGMRRAAVLLHRRTDTRPGRKRGTKPKLRVVLDQTEPLFPDL